MKQILGSLPAQLLLRMREGGQIPDLCDVGVIDADDRQILRNLHSFFFQQVQKLRGKFIVIAQDPCHTFQTA